MSHHPFKFFRKNFGRLSHYLRGFSRLSWAWTEIFLHILITVKLNVLVNVRALSHLIFDLYGLGTLFVIGCHLFISKILNWLQYLNIIPPETLALDDPEVVLVLSEDICVQELSRKGKTVDIFQCYVHEIASFPIHDIVVQYYLAALLFFGDCDGALVVLSSPVGVSKANEAFSHEVNLTYFLFFLTNYLVILVVTPEKTGHEPKRNLIDELTICHKLRFEEALVLIKNVREQIVSCYLLFNIYLDLFEHAIWVFETCKSIICPEMVHVYFDLVDERLAEWSLIGKSGKPNDPLRKVIGSVGGTHLGFLALDDLYKVSHNEGKESDTSQHNDY